MADSILGKLGITERGGIKVVPITEEERAHQRQVAHDNKEYFQALHKKHELEDRVRHEQEMRKLRGETEKLERKLHNDAYDYEKDDRPGSSSGCRASSSSDKGNRICITQQVPTSAEGRELYYMTGELYGPVMTVKQCGRMTSDGFIADSTNIKKR